MNDDGRKSHDRPARKYAWLAAAMVFALLVLLGLAFRSCGPSGPPTAIAPQPPAPAPAPISPPVAAPTPPRAPVRIAVPLVEFNTLCFGMSLPEVTGLAGPAITKQTGRPDGPRVSLSCEALNAVIEIHDGALQSVRVSGPGTRTLAGIKVGAAVAEVLAAHGTPDEQTAGPIGRMDYYEGHLRFETQDDRVRRITAAAPERLPPVPPPFGQTGVVFGMTKSEMAAALGPPDEVKGSVSWYYGRGFGLVMGERGLKSVRIPDPRSLPKDRALGEFKGRTSEGIGIGSTEAQVVAALGRPDRFLAHSQSDPNRPRMYEYWKRRLWLGLRGGEVVAMDCRMPAAPVPDAPVPAEGVEQLRFGMSAEEITAVLGEADRRLESPSGPILVYCARGIGARVTPWSGLSCVDCLSAGWSAPRMTAMPEAVARLKDFPGATAEGIHIGSTAEQLVAAYGPDAGGGMSHPRDPARKRYSLWRKGLAVDVVGGKVAQFSFYAPGTDSSVLFSDGMRNDYAPHPRPPRPSTASQPSP